MNLQPLRLALDAEPASGEFQYPSSSNLAFLADVLEWTSRYRPTLENWGKASDAEKATAKDTLKEVLGIPKELGLRLMAQASSAILPCEGAQVVLGFFSVLNHQERDKIWRERMEIKYDDSRPLSDQEDTARKEAELETKICEHSLSKAIIHLKIDLQSGDVTFEGTPITGKADTLRQIHQITEEYRITLSPVIYNLNTNADICVGWRTTKKGARWEIHSFSDPEYLFSPKAKEFKSESVDQSEIERRAAVRNWKTSYRDLDEGGRLLRSSGGTFFQASPGEPFRRCAVWVESGRFRGDSAHEYCLTPAGHVYHVWRQTSVKELVAGEAPDPATLFYKTEKRDWA